MTRPPFTRFATTTLCCAVVLIQSVPLPAADSEPNDASEVDFHAHVKPILEAACVRCHNPEEDKGSVLLHTREAALASISDSDVVTLVPGKPDESALYTTTILPPDDEMIMPPKDPVLDPSQTDKLKAWIAAGAPWPEDVVLEAVTRIDFVKHVQPILEVSCVSCHKPDKDEGGLDLTTREAAFSTGDNAPNIIPFDAEDSAVHFLTALDPDDDALMPPAKNGGPLPKDDIDKLRLWIAQGAIWPEGLVLEQKEKTDSGQPPSPDNLDLVREIHAAIVEKADETSQSEMKEYAETIPKTGATFTMVPIPGGEFRMGSPETEKGRNEDEGPQRDVAVAPFWMGKHEVTWDEYEPFMITPVDRFKDGARKNMPPDADLVDAVSQPTTPYTEMSFGMGQLGFPAISMTQHAANKYCQWLSAQTGHFYRLPTEAEWEYAARAGTTTAYFWGDDPSKMDEYAWNYDNADDKYQKVGQKKPNPWGLHDILGNVREWTLDQYAPDSYTRPLPIDTAGVGWVQPTELYPRAVRGGSWYEDPVDLRSARRFASDASWKQQDPQLPKSIWYHTDAKWLGFRIVRPLAIPSPEEMHAYWNSGIPPARAVGQPAP